MLALTAMYLRRRQTHLILIRPPIARVILIFPRRCNRHAMVPLIANHRAMFIYVDVILELREVGHVCAFEVVLLLDLACALFGDGLEGAERVGAGAVCGGFIGRRYVFEPYFEDVFEQGAKGGQAAGYDADRGLDGAPDEDVALGPTDVGGFDEVADGYDAVEGCEANAGFVSGGR
tara:strand:- start:26593 stop:27120 length:528 start_codon:yes stop_codon:yes gene_type:complete